MNDHLSDDAAPAAAAGATAPAGITGLERQILLAKGLTETHLVRLAELGVTSRHDFSTVGDAVTLRQLLPDLGDESAGEVIRWATGATGATGSTGATAQVVIESSDTVHCVHCGTRQPKDYSSGDLCVACGKQAEPIMSCHWCSSSGPGAFCRQCGAEFVPTAEVDLAILLRREGIAKHEIPVMLRAMSDADKDVLWGRVRKSRG